MYFSPFQQSSQLLDDGTKQYWKLFISLFNVFSTVLNAIRCRIPWCVDSLYILTIVCEKQRNVIFIS